MENRDKWLHKLSSLTGALLITAGTGVSANPHGGVLAAGQASISGSGNTLTINQQSQAAIINWQGFSINADELTQFIQPNSNAATLNRVLGNNLSEIYGSLQANGSVYLINPNGIIVGASGTINTQSFIASTLGVSNADFMDGGELDFIGDSNATIINLGHIEAMGGDVYLIAHKIQNHGSLIAHEGNIGIAAGSHITLQTAGQDKIAVRVAADDASIDQAGLIEATQIELRAANNNPYALAINHSGISRATSAVEKEGRIILMAEGSADVGGVLDASASIEGNGGFIETSATQHIRIADSVSVNTSSANGETGTWLIDPEDIEINSTQTIAGASVINASTIEGNLNITNVVIETDDGMAGNGDITVNQSINSTSANSLTLNADRNITVNQSVTVGGDLNLNGGHGAAGTDGSNANGVAAGTNGQSGATGGDLFVNAALTSTAGSINLQSGNGGAGGKGGDGFSSFTGTGFGAGNGGAGARGGDISLNGAGALNAANNVSLITGIGGQGGLGGLGGHDNTQAQADHGGNGGAGGNGGNIFSNASVQAGQQLQLLAGVAGAGGSGGEARVLNSILAGKSAQGGEGGTGGSGGFISVTQNLDAGAALIITAGHGNAGGVGEDGLLGTYLLSSGAVGFDGNNGGKGGAGGFINLAATAALTATGNVQISTGHGGNGSHGGDGGDGTRERTTNQAHLGGAAGAPGQGGQAGELTVNSSINSQGNIALSTGNGGSSFSQIPNVSFSNAGESSNGDNGSGAALAGRDGVANGNGGSGGDLTIAAVLSATGNVTAVAGTGGLGSLGVKGGDAGLFNSALGLQGDGGSGGEGGAGGQLQLNTSQIIGKIITLQSGTGGAGGRAGSTGFGSFITSSSTGGQGGAAGALLLSQALAISSAQSAQLTAASGGAGGDAVFGGSTAGAVGAYADMLLGHNINVLGGGSLNINSAGALTQNVSLSTTGAGNINLTSGTGLLLNSGAGITTDTGNITLNGNNDAVADNGDFEGITLDNADILTASGAITLTGRAGNNAAQPGHERLNGLDIKNGSTIISTGTGSSVGAITLTGAGGNGTNSNYGIFLQGASTRISSVDGDILVTGSAGTNTGNFNQGVLQYNGAAIETTGTGADAGNITITGVADASSPGVGGNNFGYNLYSANSTVQTVDGNITINGTGGGTAGDSNHGIQLGWMGDHFGQLLSTNGNINLTGTAGGGTAPKGVVFANPNGSVSTGGDLTITSVAGAVSNNNVINANNFTVNSADGFDSGMAITATGAIDITAANTIFTHASSTLSAGSDVSLSTSVGNISATPLITGNNITLINTGLNGAIGSSVSNVQTAATGTVSASAANGTGGIFISQQGDLNLASFDAGTGSGSLAAVDGSLSSLSALNAGGDTLSITTTEAGTDFTANNRSIILAGINANGTALTITSADDITINGNVNADSLVASTGAGLSMADGSGDDGERGGNILLNGSVTTSGNISLTSGSGGEGGRGDAFGSVSDRSGGHGGQGGDIAIMGEVSGNDLAIFTGVGGQAGAGRSLLATATAAGGLGGDGGDGGDIAINNTLSLTGNASLTSGAGGDGGLGGDARTEAIYNQTGLAGGDGGRGGNSGVIALMGNNTLAGAVTAATGIGGHGGSGGSGGFSSSSGSTLNPLAGRGGHGGLGGGSGHLQVSGSVDALAAHLSTGQAGAGGSAGTGGGTLVIPPIPGSPVGPSRTGNGGVGGVGGSAGYIDISVEVMVENFLTVIAGDAGYGGSGGNGGDDTNGRASSNNGGGGRLGGQGGTGGAVIVRDTLNSNSGDVSLTSGAGGNGGDGGDGGNGFLPSGLFFTDGGDGGSGGQGGAAGDVTLQAAVDAGQNITVTVSGVGTGGNGGAGGAADSSAQAGANGAMGSAGAAGSINNQLKLTADTGNISVTGNLNLDSTQDVVLNAGQVAGSLFLSDPSDISVTGAANINLRAQTVNLTHNLFADSGNITLTSGQGIVVNPGKRIQTTSGTITLDANSDAQDAVAFNGIHLDNAVIETVSGNINLMGRGGGLTTSNHLHGILLANNSQINSTGTGSSVGDITLNGTSGDGVTSNYGVWLKDAGTRIESVNADMLITGNTGNTTGDYSMGVLQTGGATLLSSGTGPDAGAITINGTGGAGGQDNYGYNLYGSNSVVQTADGDITITGTGGNSLGGFNHGVLFGWTTFHEAAVLTDSGDVTINGTAGTSGSGIIFANPNGGINTDANADMLAGDLTLTSTVGEISNNSALNANNITINSAAGFDSGMALSALGAINITAANTISTHATSTLTATGDINLNNSAGDMSLGADISGANVTLSAGSHLNLNVPLIATGNVLLSSGNSSHVNVNGVLSANSVTANAGAGGSVIVNQSIDASGNINLTAGNGAAGAQGVDATASFTAVKAATAGSVGQSGGAIQINAALTSAAGSISLRGGQGGNGGNGGDGTDGSNTLSLALGAGGGDGGSGGHVVVGAVLQAAGNVTLTAGKGGSGGHGGWGKPTSIGSSRGGEGGDGGEGGQMLLSALITGGALNAAAGQGGFGGNGGQLTSANSGSIVRTGHGGTGGLGGVLLLNVAQLNANAAQLSAGHGGRGGYAGIFRLTTHSANGGNGGSGGAAGEIVQAQALQFNGTGGLALNAANGGKHQQGRAGQGTGTAGSDGVSGQNDDLVLNHAISTAGDLTINTAGNITGVGVLSSANLSLNTNRGGFSFNPSSPDTHIGSAAQALNINASGTISATAGAGTGGIYLSQQGDLDINAHSFNGGTGDLSLTAVDGNLTSGASVFNFNGTNLLLTTTEDTSNNTAGDRNIQIGIGGINAANTNLSLTSADDVIIDGAINSASFSATASDGKAGSTGSLGSPNGGRGSDGEQGGDITINAQVESQVGHITLSSGAGGQAGAGGPGGLVIGGINTPGGDGGSSGIGGRGGNINVDAVLISAGGVTAEAGDGGRANYAGFGAEGYEAAFSGAGAIANGHFGASGNVLGTRSGGGIRLSSVTATGDITLTAGGAYFAQAGGNIVFDGVVSTTGKITATAGAGRNGVNNAVTDAGHGGSIQVNQLLGATGEVVLMAGNGGNRHGSGAAGNAGSLSLNAGVTSQQNIILTTGEGGNVGGDDGVINGQLNLTANTGNITVNGVITPDAGSSVSLLAGTQAGQTLSFNNGFDLTGNGSLHLQGFGLGLGSNFSTQNGNITLSGGMGNLALNGTVQSTGTGAMNLSSGMGLSLGSGALLQTTSGNITLDANSAAQDLAAFSGIYLDNAVIQTTSGAISLTGRGGSVAGGDNLHGILLENNSQITSTGAGSSVGAITLNGTSGDAEFQNYGVWLKDAGTRIESVDADMLITGTAGSTTDDFNIGVRQNDAVLTTTGTGVSAGNITINGTGGTGSSNNYGYHLIGSNAVVQTTEGDIAINGTGGNSSSTVNYGVLFGGGLSFTHGASVLSNSGDVTVNGVGGSNALGINIVDSAGSFNTNVDADMLAGDLTLTSTVGGIWSNSALSANNITINSAGNATVGGVINPGAGGSVSLSAFNTLALASNIAVTGAGDLFLQATSLSSGNSFSSEDGDITLISRSGDLTLANGFSASSTGAGNIVLVADNNLVNNTGGFNPLTVNTGRWLIYSHRPDHNTNAALADMGEDFVRYSTNFDSANPIPTGLPAGNGMLFAVQPRLTGVAVTVNNQNIHYGQIFDANDFSFGGGSPASFELCDPTCSAIADPSLFGLTLPSSINSNDVELVLDPAVTLSSSGFVNSGSYIDGLVAGFKQGSTLGALGIAISGTGDLTVNAAALTISANNGVKSYGDNLSFLGTEFTSTGLVAGDSISTVSLNSAGAVNTANVNNYAIVASNPVGGVFDANNYTINFVDGNLAVNPAALTITANDDSKTYEGAAYTGGNGVSYSGFVNGEADSVLSGSLSFSGAAQGAVNAGTYSLSASGLSSGNYAIDYVDGTLEIDPAALQVTALNNVKTYGDSLNFAGTEFGTAGLVGGQTIDSVNLSSSGAAGAANVASYGIVASNPVGGSFNAANYTISFVDGSLAVNPAALILTATDDSSVYSGAAYTGGNGVSGTGFVNGDGVADLAGSLVFGGTAQGAVDVGVYGLSATGLSSGNYLISYVDGNVQISPATLTVSADNVIKDFDGNAFSGGSVSYAGFVNGEDVSLLSGSLVFGGSAQGAVNGGTYVISASGLSGANYAINYVGGLLKINVASVAGEQSVAGAGLLAQQAEAQLLADLSSTDFSILFSPVNHSLEKQSDEERELDQNGGTQGKTPAGAVGLASSYQ